MRCHLTNVCCTCIILSIVLCIITYQRERRYILVLLNAALPPFTNHTPEQGFDNSTIGLHRNKRSTLEALHRSNKRSMLIIVPLQVQNMKSPSGANGSHIVFNFLHSHFSRLSKQANGKAFHGTQVLLACSCTLHIVQPPWFGVTGWDDKTVENHANRLNIIIFQLHPANVPSTLEKQFSHMRFCVVDGWRLGGIARHRVPHAKTKTTTTKKAFISIRELLVFIRCKRIILMFSEQH